MTSKKELLRKIIELENKVNDLTLTLLEYRVKEVLWRTDSFIERTKQRIEEIKKEAGNHHG
jgi:hypothetical protein